MKSRIEDTFTGAGAATPFVAKLITPDGKCTPVVPKNGKQFSLKELQGFVGGYIEMVAPPSKNGAVIICNEDGKAEGLAHNKLATEMWQAHAEPGSMRMSDHLVGTILLCHRSQIN
jgi:hypothetical protein